MQGSCDDHMVTAAIAGRGIHARATARGRRGGSASRAFAVKRLSLGVPFPGAAHLRACPSMRPSRASFAPPTHHVSPHGVWPSGTAPGRYTRARARFWYREWRRPRCAARVPGISLGDSARPSAGLPGRPRCSRTPAGKTNSREVWKGSAAFATVACPVCPSNTRGSDKTAARSRGHRVAGMADARPPFWTYCIQRWKGMVLDFNRTSPACWVRRLNRRATCCFSLQHQRSRLRGRQAARYALSSCVRCITRAHRDPNAGIGDS